MEDAMRQNTRQHGQDPVIDVEKLIDDAPLSAFQWTVFIMAFLIIAADGFDTGAMGFIAPSVANEWQVARQSMGPVLSAALFGMAIGALIGGPLADRLGRKLLVWLTVLLFGGACLASATSNGVAELVAWRFLTGLGLGAAMPNMLTLLAEYMPRRIRSTMVNLVCCAFPLGIAISGVTSSYLVDSEGWRSVLWAGGLFPLLLLGILFFALPESLQFMATHEKAHEKITHVVRKIQPDIVISGRAQFVASATVVKEAAATVQAASASTGLALIVSPQFRVGTLLLWVTCFMSLLVFYLMTSWLTTLLHVSGLAQAEASRASAIFPVGGTVGAIAMGYLMDKVNSNRTLVLSYALAVFLLVLTGLFSGVALLFGIGIFLSGAMIGGAQASMPALTASFYPVEGRATGVSWMHGIGRLGAIAGTFIGAGLLSLNLSLTSIMLILAVPALIASLALMLKGNIEQHARKSEQGGNLQPAGDLT